ncbi:peroxiredoxin family protein [Alkalihalobacterium alkalinitrilicum]|uniref:peroxiredoxin family protein n=1 Tax=Alkalihalobacterium alkalinitrilicum TaxID=427920 RepID=UPI0009950178|nr:TlpA disulfide reductase family protein [Alkalihalobacterium alkalinitrilicum]
MQLRKNAMYSSFLFLLLFVVAFLYEGSNHIFRQVEVAVAASSKVGAFENEKAPNFELLNLEGKKVSLEDFRGQKVILNFFATWCPPCQEEMPLLVEIDEKLQNQNIVMLGVNMTSQERNANAVRSFLSYYKAEYDVVYDVDGKVMKDYRIMGIPTTFIIDEQGIVEKRINGMVTPNHVPLLLGKE